MRRLHRRLKAWLQSLRTKLFGPSQKALVGRIVAGVSGLEILRSECRHLAPVTDVYGPFTIEGNALPTFSYIIFDDRLMEFVKMRVVVSLPDRLTFSGETQDLGQVPIKPHYKKPFMNLATHLYRYFPLPMPVKPKEQVNAIE